MKMFRILTASVLLVFATGCNHFYQAQSLRYNDYAITSQLKEDSSILSLLKPYSDSVNQNMNDIVAEVATKLEKKRPETTLGNFIADAMLYMARQKFDAKADVAFVNYGGIRVNAIFEGPLRRGTIYEAMPFDNLMVLVPVKGSLLKQYLDGIAKEGAAGVAGLTMVMRNGRAEEIKIGGKDFEEHADYVMVNSDYSTRGPLFVNIPLHETTYLVRDAIIDYCKWHNNQDRKISVLPENRLIYGH